jgi:hypothetical protein
VKKRQIDIDRFIEMYNSGTPYSQLSEEFNLCPSTVKEKIKELGLPGRRESLSLDIEEFRAAYYSGLSSYKLSEKFGICRSTVTRIVKELKLRESMNALHRMECYAEI